MWRRLTKDTNGNTTYEGPILREPGDVYRVDTTVTGFVFMLFHVILCCVIATILVYTVFWICRENELVLSVTVLETGIFPSYVYVILASQRSARAWRSSRLRRCSNAKCSEDGGRQPGRQAIHTPLPPPGRRGRRARWGEGGHRDQTRPDCYTSARPSLCQQGGSTR